MKPIIDPLSFDVLKYLHEHGNSNSTDIINGVHHSSNNVYKKLKEFTKMGLVTRTVDDNRSVYYWHTQAGMNVYGLLEELNSYL